MHYNITFIQQFINRKISLAFQESTAIPSNILLQVEENAGPKVHCSKHSTERHLQATCVCVCVCYQWLTSLSLWRPPTAGRCLSLSAQSLLSTRAASLRVSARCGVVSTCCRGRETDRRGHCMQRTDFIAAKPLP